GRSRRDGCRALSAAFARNRIRVFQSGKRCRDADRKRAGRLSLGHLWRARHVLRGCNVGNGRVSVVRDRSIQSCADRVFLIQTRMKNGVCPRILVERLLLIVLALTAAKVAAFEAPIPRSALKQGSEFTSAEIRAMQADEFANPG